MEPDSGDSSSPDLLSIERPHRKLFSYYFIVSLLGGPFFFIALIPLYFRFHTMRYRFGDEGVSMSWGMLFRKEINLTFARIQDIHLTSNVAERWLGLARIQIQTASGSAKAEMTIEGVLAFEGLRDFLYTRMRGARGAKPGSSGVDGQEAAASAAAPAGLDSGNLSALTSTMREVVGEIRAIREHLVGRESATLRQEVDDV